MHSTTWADRLWGKKANVSYLMLAAIFLLFFMLAGRELWTQEHRWIDIVANMFFYQDFLHPQMNGEAYYDKPLLSYWLIAGFSLMMGKLSLWALRLPSALAGLLAVWCIYRMGIQVKNKQLGLLAGWLLLTTYYFVFWAHVGSADMLNLAGTLFAVLWYTEKRQQPSLFNYSIFFLILAFTALCKGLVGPVVAILFILPDLFLQKSFKTHFQWRFFLGMIPALIVYVLPFWASESIGSESYSENGLYEVYRENILRYFKPFDHKGPIYTYFIYLPAYMFPWALFFIPALFYLKTRWKNLNSEAKWIALGTLLLFLFFTASGSRRSYYILPVIPFAILMTAEWILAGTKQSLWAGRIAISSFLGLALIFLIIQPWYYAKGGVSHFQTVLKKETDKIQPWSSWQFALLDAESKITFYLALPVTIKNLDTSTAREKQTTASLIQYWPILTSQPQDTILITRKLYAPLLRSTLKNYIELQAEPTYMELILKKEDPNQPIAFIPKNTR